MVEADGPDGRGKDQQSPVSITLFFPCYNEQGNVRRVVSRAVEVLEDVGADFEIIVVDDGSSDDTGQIADELAAGDGRISVIHHDGNRGYGVALQSGFGAATKDLIFYTDGDGQFDIGELPPLLPLMADYDIVSCYRIDRQDSLMRKVNGWLWTRFTCLVFSLKIRDIDCAFKLYKREVFDSITMESTGALIDTEILARATRKGFRIVQKGVHHFPRASGHQTGANLRVVLRAFKEVLKLRKRIVKDQ